MEPCLTAGPRPGTVGKDLLPDEESRSLAALANALSDPIRVQIVHLLSQERDICTCEFEALLGLGQSKVSYHLKILLEAGVVSRTIHGTWSHYSLRCGDVLHCLNALWAATTDQQIGVFHDHQID